MDPWQRSSRINSHFEIMSFLPFLVIPMGTYNFHLLEKHTPRSIGLEEYSIGWRERSLNKYLSSKYKPNIFLPQSHTSNLANHSTREEEPLQLAQTIELKLDISIALRSPVFVHVDDDNSKFKVKRWRPENEQKTEKGDRGRDREWTAERMATIEVNLMGHRSSSMTFSRSLGYQGNHQALEYGC